LSTPRSIYVFACVFAELYYSLTLSLSDVQFQNLFTFFTMHSNKASFIAHYIIMFRCT
jgi:hypothetical protein